MLFSTISGWITCKVYCPVYSALPVGESGIQRNTFHLSQYLLLCSRQICKEADQFHSPSAILLYDLMVGTCIKISLKPPSKELRTCICSPCSFVSKDRHPETGKQKTLAHERGTTATCSLVLASCTTILLLQQNLVLYTLLRNFQLALTLDSGTGTDFDSDVTSGNVSWKRFLVF